MKKGRVLWPLTLIGLLITIVPITPAQQTSNTDSTAASPEEDCRVPVVIFGKVASPNRFELLHPTQLRELIAFAGGVTKASKGDVQIFHTEPNTICERLAPSKNRPALDIDNLKTFVETYKLSDVLRGDKQANLLRPGDMVYVGLVEHVSVIGSVMNPHQIDYSKRLTISRAITMAGGFLLDAKKENIYVHRWIGAQRQWIVININSKIMAKHQSGNIILQPNDIVEVLNQKGSTRPSTIPNYGDY